MKEIKKFNLDDEDYYAIDIAQRIIQLFLKYPNIRPIEVIGLGNALYAINRLPLVTEGAFCEFGLKYSLGTEKFSEMIYINFRISEEDFEISKGGSIYNKLVGSDSYSEHNWYIDVYGYRETELELFYIEDQIDEIFKSWS